MASIGKFIISNFQNVELEVMVTQSREWLSYSDGDAQSYTVIMAVPINYDEESGIITFKNYKGQEFYVSESFIETFWKANSGFNFVENTNSTLYNGGARKNKKRDIM